MLIFTILRELLKGESEGLLKLPTDNALLEDPAFQNYVELYAKVIYAHVSLCSHCDRLYVRVLTSF